MRCSKKKILGVLLLLIGGVYFFLPADLPTVVPTEPPESALIPEPREFITKAETSGIKGSWMQTTNYLPLNVSYELLAGEPSTEKRYLAVGISSVKRSRGMYLLLTLRSIFSKSSPEERSSMVVVVLLADFDASWKQSVVKEIVTTFPSELQQGQLVIIHVPLDFYPPLTGLKRNYNDPPRRVTFRSKQNVDYSFLINYGADLGQYYLQLEDDISCATNFLTHIKKQIRELEAKRTTWAMVEFSVLGYIGKLYKSADAPRLARFLFMFYQEMPCDWLMSHFRELLTQKENIIHKPSLFQHMGTFSSFDGGYNSLKEVAFREDIHVNPDADVFSDMSAYQQRLPRMPWDKEGEFFWSVSPKKGNYLTVVFKARVVLTSILVETGRGGRDILHSGQVEIGRDVVSTNKQKSCKEFQPVGTFTKGMFEMNEVDKKYKFTSSCLRITVTADQQDWLIINKIKVKTRET